MHDSTKGKYMKLLIQFVELKSVTKYGFYQVVHPISSYIHMSVLPF